jgi:hypothetical protein
MKTGMLIGSLQEFADTAKVMTGLVSGPLDARPR